MVYLKLQPHRPLLVLESNSSLLPKFYGPYQAEAKVGEIAYRLKLPQKAQIHLGFHVFLLKKKEGDDNVVQSQLPIYKAEEIIIAPEKVLKTRVINRDGQRILQGLIKWANMADVDTTWEDQSFILSQFPEFQSSWRQEETLGRDIVTYYKKRKTNKRSQL